VNTEEVVFAGDGQTPLLWVLRYNFAHLTDSDLATRTAATAC
jgi:hypothetical protein